MPNQNIMYDETEHTTTRYVGFIGEVARFDLMITTTAHFYGKKVVSCLQSGRAAIMSEQDANNPGYVAEAFGITDETEAEELSAFLQANL